MVLFQKESVLKSTRPQSHNSTHTVPFFLKLGLSLSWREQQRQFLGFCSFSIYPLWSGWQVCHQTHSDGRLWTVPPKLSTPMPSVLCWHRGRWTPPRVAAPGGRSGDISGGNEGHRQNQAAKVAWCHGTPPLNEFMAQFWAERSCTCHLEVEILSALAIEYGIGQPTAGPSVEHFP